MKNQGKLGIFLFVIFFHGFVQLSCMDALLAASKKRKSTDQEEEKKEQAGKKQKMECKTEVKESKSLGKALMRDEMQSLIQEASQIQHLDEKELEKIAEIKGYGYKTANLTKLQELVKKLDRFKEATGYTIQVPEFAGISSGEIQSFIKYNLEFDLDNEWNKLVEPYKNDLKSMIEKNNFPERFLDELNCYITRPIEKAFDKAIDDIDDDSTLDDIFDIQEDSETDTASEKTITTLLNQTKAALQELIKKAKNKRFMVRSTGKEDTKKLANAGGNESVANVAPTLKVLLKAMKIVIVSYFGEKSMKQRLGAGDWTLFDAPFTPVLVQLMIGENQLYGITSCGVMFTEEPEGGVSKQSDEKETKFASSGITVIQAAYGHNEGVVNSRIPVDTFYIDDTGIINSIIREKTTRLVPDKDHVGRLTMRSNPQVLRNIPALSGQAIFMLKLLAQALESYYQGPMDVEYVIDEVQKIIYIVQARPIVHNPNQPQPSYLAGLDDKKLISDKIFGRSIGVAGGALQFITNKEEVILAATINAALTSYQDEKTDRKSVKAIIIGQMAPATSHEATTFRSELKPVLQSDEFERIADWLKDPHAQLIVDMQQQVVVQLRGKLKTLKGLGQNKRDGWISYPLPLLTSLIAESDSKKAELNQDSIQKLLNIDAKTFAKILESTKKTEADARSLDDLREFIKTLKTTENADEYKMTLGKIAIFWFKLLKPYEKIIDADERLKEQSRLLTQHFFQSAEHVQKTFDYKPGTKLYTKRLYAIRFLEALLLQNSKPIDARDGYSYLTLLKSAQQAKKSLKVVGGEGENNEMIAAFNLVGNRAITSELAKKWCAFVKNLPEKNYSRLQSLLLNLNKLEALDLWLHTSFVKTYDQEIKESVESKSAEKVVQSLVAEVKSTENFLNDLALRKKRIDQLHTDSWLNAWEEPKNFNDHMSDLKKELDFFKDEKEFIQAFRDAPEIGKIIALSLMDDFVEVFDLSIKWLSRSNKYSDVHQKIDRFKAMLDENADLLLVWLTIADLNKLFPNIDNVAINKRKSYIEDFKNREFSGSEQFKSTINVAASVLGAPGYANSPVTLEDYFTFFHQCLINTNAGLLNALTKLAAIKVPAWVEKLKKATSRPGVVTLMGIHFKQDVILFKYNYPLSGHSATLEIKFNAKQKKATLSANFWGDVGFNRFEVIANYIEVLSKVLDLQLMLEQRIGGRTHLVFFKWTFTEDEVNKGKTDYLNNYIYCAALITFESTNKAFDITYQDLTPEQQINFSKEIIASWHDHLQKVRKFDLNEMIVKAVKKLPAEGAYVSYFVKAAEMVVASSDYSIRSLIREEVALLIKQAATNAQLKHALQENKLLERLLMITDVLPSMNDKLKLVEEGIQDAHKIIKLLQEAQKNDEDKEVIESIDKKLTSYNQNIIRNILENIINSLNNVLSEKSKIHVTKFFGEISRRIEEIVEMPAAEINYAYLAWIESSLKDVLQILEQLQRVINYELKKVEASIQRKGDEKVNAF